MRRSRNHENRRISLTLGAKAHVAAERQKRKELTERVNKVVRQLQLRHEEIKVAHHIHPLFSEQEADRKTSISMILLSYDLIIRRKRSYDSDLRITKCRQSSITPIQISSF
jgi:hypothetical protein